MIFFRRIWRWYYISNPLILLGLHTILFPFYYRNHNKLSHLLSYHFQQALALSLLIYLLMKIRCDVCDKEEASVFCTADEASLCDGCDHRVHHANKLASKHLRFSLLYPSSSKNSSPICDICQVSFSFLSRF